MIMKLSEFREQQEVGFAAPSLQHQDRLTSNVYVLIDKYEHADYKIRVIRYHLAEGEWIATILYDDNDWQCAMVVFDDCLNNSIVDPLEGLKFTCPSCKGHRLECCQDGYHVSEVTCINEEGDHDYGTLQSHGEVIRWQCLSCGCVIEDSFGNDIVDNVEIAEWIKENCKDEKVS
jgi:hypothetical protein